MQKYITLITIKIRRVFNYIKDYFKYAPKEIIFNEIKPNDKFIFVLRTDMIGDYVISKDFLRLLRQSDKFKDYKIVLLTGQTVKDFVMDFDKKYIDVYISAYLPFLFKKKRLFNLINKYKYDYVLNYMLVRNEYSEIIVKNIKTGIKLGINPPKWSLNIKRKTNDKLYDKLYDVVDSYSLGSKDFLEQISKSEIGEYKHQFILSSQIQNEINKNFVRNYAILFPSASCFAKRMPFEKFALLAEYMYKKYGIISYISGSSEDKQIFKKFNIDLPYLKDICGKYKLSELPYVFKNAKIILTNDTCAMHIGKCVNDNILVFSNVRCPVLHNVQKIEKNNKTYFLDMHDNFYWIYPEKNYYSLFNNLPVMPNESLQTVNLENAIYAIDKIWNLYI